MLHRNGNCSRADKRWTTGQHLKHYDTQRIEIGRSREFLTSGLLRRKIISSAKYYATISKACILSHAHNAKVSEFDQNTSCGSTTGNEHNILRFDVPMNKAPRMCDLQDLAYLRRNLQSLAPLYLPPLPTAF